MEGTKTFLKKFLAKPSGLIGSSIVTLLIFSALMAEIISPHSPTKMGAGKRFSKPSTDYFLGTDEFGRDMLSRILHSVWCCSHAFRPWAQAPSSPFLSEKSDTHFTMNIMEIGMCGERLTIPLNL